MSEPLLEFAEVTMSFPAGEAASRTVYLVDKPGAAQSIIRIGGVGVPR